MIGPGLTERVPRVPRSEARELGRPRSRRWIALVLALGLAVGTVGWVAIRRYRGSCVPPVAARAVTDLQSWTDWLAANNARGYVGEVGWPGGPDASAWNAVGSSWFTAADRANLWVTVWAAGRWWPDSYRLAVYRLSGSRAPTQRGSQVAVVAPHLDVPGALRGVDLPSGAFRSGASVATYSGSRPGTYLSDYYYEDADDYHQLAMAGTSLVRLSVNWERLQHRPGAPLDSRELGRLRQSLEAAADAGLAVVIDLHGYGDYWAADGTGHRRLTLGSVELPDAAFADFWNRMSIALRTSTAVIGYGLMNEPTRLDPDPAAGARIWEDASAAAAAAIRATGDHRTLLVSGYGGASPRLWSSYHPRAWIADPVGQVRYEMHQYFDADRTGNYAQTFAREQELAVADGYPACPPA